MASYFRQAIAPGYLLLCLVLGGSAQGIWSNALLQLCGLGIIGWAAAAPRDEPLGRVSRQLVWLLIAGLILVALQLVPLPASVWSELGGRQAIAQGYRVLGLAIPARPLSLAPHEGLATMLALIPGIATFSAIAVLKAYRRSWLVLALLVGALGGIVLGMLQVSSADPRTSSWYLYPQSSFGFATGFFANANNMAMLLLLCLPFVAALLASARGATRQRYSTVAFLLAIVALVLVIGIALNGSLAGYGLAVPVLAASAILLMPARRGRRLFAAAAGGLLVVAVVVLAFSPVGERMLGTSLSLQSRAAIMSTTAQATKDFLPFGSGLGTFRGVYQLYEDHDRVGHVRVNHAHNDYLELALELGAPGTLLLAAFLAWWVFAAAQAWRSTAVGPYPRAASIASAVLLAHSFVEFPLRTAALSACFAMCLALLAGRAAPRRVEHDDLRPTRHVELR